MDPSPHGSTRTREGCKLQRGAPEASAQAWLRNEDRVTHECRLTLSILRTSGRFALRPSARYFPSQSSDDFTFHPGHSPY